jgi:N-acetylglucosamine-6-phosphate deacetylase
MNSYGAVDIHFHGAFGIDLMSAEAQEMDRLARLLRARGIAAFCPTTLSVPWPKLVHAVRRIGQWIAQRRLERDPRGALPVGIHLEGPYISPAACGAHPHDCIRKLKLRELDELWEASSHQLKILTIAPETATPAELKKLVRWAKARAITLSLGHSRATEAQAKAAFDQGFSSVTHAWNACHFHPRSPGVIGAALGRPDVHLELILDQVHVSPTVMRWTREQHGGPIAYVSDCVPSAATSGGGSYSFGHLKIQLKDGAGRLSNGALAGGGTLLVDAFARWIEAEAARSGIPAAALLRDQLPHLCQAPLRSIGLKPHALGLGRVEWQIGASGRVRARPL